MLVFRGRRTRACLAQAEQLNHAETDHDLSVVLFAALFATAGLVAFEFGLFNKMSDTRVETPVRTADAATPLTKTDFNTFFTQRIQLR